MSGIPGSTTPAIAGLGITVSAVDRINTLVRTPSFPKARAKYRISVPPCRVNYHAPVLSLTLTRFSRMTLAAWQRWLVHTWKATLQADTGSQPEPTRKKLGI